MQDEPLPAIRLITLGGFRCYASGSETASLQAQRLRAALLVFLAVEAETTRERVMSTLWPERDPDRARHALSQTLYELRRTLGGAWIMAEGDRLRVTDALDLDAAEFVRAVSEGDDARAIEIYRGHFLANQVLADTPAFEHWVDVHRRKLRTLHLRSRLRLIETEVAGGRLDQAIQLARRGVELGPDDDEMQHRLLELLLHAGRRSEALEAYAAYERFLAPEGLRPLDTTRELMERARIEPIVAAPLSMPPERLHPAGGGRGTARPAPLAPRRRALRWILAAAAVAVIAIVAVFIIVDPPGEDGGVYRIAFPPFQIPADSAALQEWSGGLPYQLAQYLDGAGPIRVIPMDAVTRVAPAVVDRAAALDIGRRTGADLVVFGSLIATTGDSVRASATMLVTGTGRVHDEIEIRGGSSYGSVAGIADSLVVEILSSLGRILPLRTVRATPIAKPATWPALRAFLRGEQFQRQAAWDSAIAEYRRAVDEDSTYALALSHLGHALGWRGTHSDAEVRAYALRAGAHNRGLGLRDSLMIAADSLAAAAEDASDAPEWLGPLYWRLVRNLFETRAQARQQYGQDPEVWYAWADDLYHYGVGPEATTGRAILDALQHAIALDSLFAPAYPHAIELALRYDEDLGLRLAKDYLTLASGHRSARVVRVLTDMLEPDLDEQLARAADEDPDLLVAAANMSDRWTHASEPALSLIRARVLGDPDASSCPPSSESNAALAVRLLFRGRLREARCALDGLQNDLLPQLVWLEVVPAASGLAMFDEITPEWSLYAVLWLPWLADRRDTARIERVRQQAASLARASRDSGEQARAAYDTLAANAYRALARGDTSEAIRRFEALPDTLCITCFPHDRFVRARLLAHDGQHERAHGLFAEWRGSTVSILEVLGALEAGRLEERLGRTAEAVESYRFVAAIWAAADPELQGYVQEATEAVAGLTRSADPGR